MKFGLIAAMAPLMLLAGTAVQAQNTPSDSAPPKPAVKEKKICQTEDDIGSIVPKRTCHTKAEWAAINAQQQTASDNDSMRRGQQH
jgi:hypothetical protein